MSKQDAATLLRFLYSTWLVFSMFSLMFVPSQLIDWSNAEITAQNIFNNQLLFRTGIAGSLIVQLIFIFVALSLYKLFNSVSKQSAILLVAFALISVPIAMLNEVNKITALTVIENPEQVLIYLKLNSQGINIASIFWGLWLFPLANLIYRSGYFPKFLGIAVFIGGLGYIFDAFLTIIFPDLNIEALGYLAFGETVFVLWIIIRGAHLKS